MSSQQVLSSFNPAAVSIVEGPLGTTAANSVTFAGIPANGNLIVLLVTVTTASATRTLTTPTGFNVGLIINQGGNATACYWRIASSEASATYTVSGSGTGTTRVFGYVFRGHNVSTPIGNTGSNSDDTTGTSLACASAAISVSAGSIVIALRGLVGTVTSPAFDNSFTGVIANTGSTTDSATAYRAYTSAGVSQNSTASWINTRLWRRTLLVEIKP